jgi:hypothetical protein
VIKKIVFVFILTLFVSLIVTSIKVQAGSAGVGVVNVPPEYSDIKIITEDGIKKIYLTISDYNSWSDVYTVEVTIKNGGETSALFEFRQYTSLASYTPTVEFKEEVGNKYLILDECSASHSDKTETISERCLIHIVFAFQPIPQTELIILTKDRGGLHAHTWVEFDRDGVPRSPGMIFLPWMLNPIEFSRYTLEALTIAIAATATAVIIKKRVLEKRGQSTI